jgi:hypothetical protein
MRGIQRGIRSGYGRRARGSARDCGGGADKRRGRRLAAVRGVPEPVPLRPLPGGPAGARGLRASDRTAGAVRQRNPVRGVPGANQLLRLHDTIQRLRLM